MFSRADRRATGCRRSSARPTGSTRHQLRRDLVRRHARQPEQQQHHRRVERRDDDLEQQEEERAQRRHARCARRLSRRRAAPTRRTRGRERSPCSSGKSPSRSVFSPLPVSTSIGCAPTASAACRSRSESPMQGTPVMSTPKRWPISSQHARLRLAAFALRVAGVRAEEDRVDAPARPAPAPCASSRGSRSASPCRTGRGRCPTGWWRRRRESRRG